MKSLESLIENARPVDQYPDPNMGRYIDHIKKQEGFSPSPYEDGKYKSIGYGHNGADVNEWEESFGGQVRGQLDKEEATRLAAHDINIRLHQIRQAIPAFDSFSEELKDQIVDATYRGSLVGKGRSASPRTVALLNAGDFKAASQEFLNYAEYRERKEKNSNDGVVRRMESTSAAMLAEHQRVNPFMGSDVALEEEGIHIRKGSLADATGLTAGLVNALVSAKSFFLESGVSSEIIRARTSPVTSVLYKKEKGKKTESSHAAGSAADLYAAVPEEDGDSFAKELEKVLNKNKKNRYAVHYETQAAGGFELPLEDRHFHIQDLS